MSKATNELTHDGLRRRCPYPLIPTNLDGVFTSPPFPAEFDPNTASPTRLIGYGLMWPRPGNDADPRLRAAWQRAFSRRWDPEKRIVPVLRPQRSRTHVRMVLEQTEAAFISNNWSGGSIKGSWNGCIGFWAVPTVSQPAERQGQEGGWNSSSWIGIDGAYGSNDVLQAGIEQRVDGQGNASYVAWFEWFAPGQPGGTISDISNNKLILGDTSPVSPSLASCAGNLYLSWKGDGNDNLNVMVSTDNGASLGQKMVSPETSDDSPALASDGRTLFIAWKGSGNDNLNVATVSLDAASGSPIAIVNKTILGDTSPVRPALAMLNGSIYLAWKGDGNDNLNVMVSTDGGKTFGNKFISGETSPAAPALGINDGSLFIGWKGDGNDNLNVAVVDIDESTGAPTGFSNKVTLGDTSPLNPTLAGMNGYLFLGWKGDGNDNLNLMFSSDDSSTFGGKMISPETSPDAPAVTQHNGNLFFAWKGDGNDNLNVARVDVTGFTVPPYVFQVNIPNFPAKPGDTIYCSVQYINSRSAGQIYLANDTTGEHFSLTIAPPPGATFNGNGVEWIMEAPDGGLPTSALPKFTSVQFTTALGCGADGHTVGNPQNGDTWTIEDFSQNPPLVLTATTLGNDAVTVTFKG
jgi:Peptidase A4 family